MNHYNIDTDTVISQLNERISTLENENRLLKERLLEAGIFYADIVPCGGKEVPEPYDPDQGARIKEFKVTEEFANTFFMGFFMGRRDVYSLRRTNPKTGRNGYYTQCNNFWKRGCHKKAKDDVRCKDCEYRSYTPLNRTMIEKHLMGNDPLGNDVVAIYPMLENNLCKLLVFDFDNHAMGAEQDDHANADEDWKAEVNALRLICGNLDVDCLVERSRSGRGAHLWLFFAEMIPARLARRFGFALLEKGAESVNLKSFRYYDRMNHKAGDGGLSGKVV